MAGRGWYAGWYGSLVAAALGVALVVGCSSGGSSGTGAAGGGNATPGATAGSTASWVALTPAAKGPVSSITWDLPDGEPTSLDPTQSAAQPENTVLANLCESLVRLTPQLTYEPGLATSYSQPNPTTWVYDIRQGVHFWNGQPLTANDVVYSLERNLSPSVGSLWGDPFYSDVKSIKATGPYQVTVTLTQPDVVFNEMMATAAGAIGEASYIQAKGKSYGTAKGGLMCTGPYELQSWTPGSQLVITKNPNYWDSALQPKVGKITFLFITDPSTVTNGLVSGQIDGAYEVPISAVPTLRQSSVGKLYLGTSTEFSVLSFTTKAGPIRSPLVRRALSLALNRQAIASTVFAGTAVPAYSLDFPSTWGYAKSTFQQGYNALVQGAATNLTEAKKLVVQAGSPKQALSMLVSADDPGAVQTALYVKSAASQIGLTINIAQVPAAQSLSIQFDPKARVAYDIMMQDVGYYDIPDPIEQALFSLQPGALFNYDSYTNAQVDKDITAAQGTADPVARATLINQLMAQAIGKDAATVVLVNFAERLFMNASITGAPAGIPAYLYYPWAALVGSSK
jgi:peptide/nickel transport system substrate-binding protein